MLTLAVHAGLRVSELIGLDCGDIVLGTGAHVRCHGKGRKQRAVPLTADAQAVLARLARRTRRPPRGPAVSDPHRPPPQPRRRRATRQHPRQDRRHHCASLATKHLHPHVLRHSCAMSLLQAGVDTTVIALWLGHADVRSTQPYLHADLTIKEKALALVTPPTVTPGRYKPPDALLAFLEDL